MIYSISIKKQNQKTKPQSDTDTERPEVRGAETKHEETWGK